MNDSDTERIMELLMAQWIVLVGRMYPGKALHVVSRGPDGEILQTTWADFDPDPKKQRKTIGPHPIDVDHARKRVGLE